MDSGAVELEKARWVEVNGHVDCGYPGGYGISSLFGALYLSISRVSSNIEGST